MENDHSQYKRLPNHTRTAPEEVVKPSQLPSALQKFSLSLALSLSLSPSNPSILLLVLIINKRESLEVCFSNY